MKLLFFSSFLCFIAGEAEAVIRNGGERGDDMQKTLVRGGMETLVTAKDSGLTV